MKKWYSSKTVWFNLLTTLVLVAQLVGEQFQEYLPVTVLIAGLGNILLRVWFTDSEVEKSIR